MRVAIFTEAYLPFVSGVITHIQTLKQGLEAYGHEVLIVACNPKATDHYEENGVLYCPGIPLKRIYGYGFSNPVNLERLKIIEKFNPDIIHIHSEFSMGIFAKYAASKLKKPLVYTMHTMYDDYLFYVAPHKLEKMVKPAAHMYFKQIAESATEVIGPSVKVVEFLKRCDVDRHINIVPNTVDLSDFLSDNVDNSKIEDIKSELGIRKNDIAMCFVGRLGKEKSIDVLIDFLTIHFKGDDRYKLFIIGDGPERESLEEQIVKREMESQIKLLGKIEHSLLPPYYQACSLYTTASLSEINSISMLEAMASGLYVIQRFDLYNKSQITTGENGATYTTAEEMAELLIEQTNLSPEEKQTRRETVTACATRYGVKEFIDSIMDVYERAMARNVIERKRKKRFKIVK